jgi:hypothetical protein
MRQFNEGHGSRGRGMPLYRHGESLYEGHGFSRAVNALIMDGFSR